MRLLLQRFVLSRMLQPCTAKYKFNVADWSVGPQWPCELCCNANPTFHDMSHQKIYSSKSASVSLIARLSCIYTLTAEQVLLIGGLSVLSRAIKSISKNRTCCATSAWPRLEGQFLMSLLWQPIEYAWWQVLFDDCWKKFINFITAELGWASNVLYICILWSQPDSHLPSC